MIRLKQKLNKNLSQGDLNDELPHIKSSKLSLNEALFDAELTFG